ncbi:MAG: hypothetical protein J5642_02805, partial [Bacteroidales bacterium]|nr:hypothetical protein [Bacteroidales bacterium]
DIEKAIHIWENEDSLSSLQNRMICYFLQEDIPAAIKTAEQLYARHGEDYQQCTLPSVHIQMERSGLIHQFIDMLDKEMSVTKIVEYCYDTEWSGYISTKCSKEFLAAIDKELRMAEDADKADAKVRKRTADLLMEKTYPLFTELKNIFPTDDVQYSFIADEVTLFILDCCVFYYMSSPGDVTDRLKDLRPLLDYAQNLVCGESAASRLDEFISFTQSDARIQEITNSPEYQRIMEYAKRQGGTSEDDDKRIVLLVMLSVIITTIAIVTIIFVKLFN